VRQELLAALSLIERVTRRAYRRAQPE